MKILIVTGIYPPDIGGPALYAQNLKDAWSTQGHEVSVRVFSRFNFLPTGIRHLCYFFYILPAVSRSERILALDTFSAALPGVLAAKLLGKKIILRTGGDFLWESHVERTGELVLLRDFYQSSLNKLSAKEQKVFKLIRFVLRKVNAIVWSTEWQKNIFMKPYGLQHQQHFIIENYYGPKAPSQDPRQKNFIAGMRRLKWKNVEALERVFGEGKVGASGAVLDTTNASPDQFKQKIANAYAVVLASLGDISPNTILEAIRFGKPFIVTRECGISERIKDCAVFVNPQDDNDIIEKVIWLCDEKNYALQRQRVINFTFTHTWEEMSKEYLDIWNKV